METDAGPATGDGAVVGKEGRAGDRPGAGRGEGAGAGDGAEAGEEGTAGRGEGAGIGVPGGRTGVSGPDGDALPGDPPCVVVLAGIRESSLNFIDTSSSSEFSL